MKSVNHESPCMIIFDEELPYSVGSQQKLAGKLGVPVWKAVFGKWSGSPRPALLSEGRGPASTRAQRSEHVATGESNCEQL